DADQLDDDVEDRAGGERQERDAEPFAHIALTDERPEERRTAADQAAGGEEAPGRALPLGRERSDDAEGLGGVVQPEADDQQHGEADLVLRGGLPDGQALREVVESDPERDEQRQPMPFVETVDAPDEAELAGRGGTRAEVQLLTAPLEPPVVVHEPDEADADASDEEQPASDERAPLAVFDGFLDRLEGVLERLDQQEDEDARRGGVEQRTNARRHRADARDGQADEAGESCDRPEAEAS